VLGLGVAIATLGIALEVATPALAQDASGTSMSVPLAANAPDEYVVKKGDTLWDISAVFLRDPWYWPEIWYVNPQVKNPHLIYPGDVLHLVYVDGKPRITMERGDTVHLSPQMRSERLENAIPASGTTGEEQKMIDETRKILEAPQMRIGVTCVRVPVFNGHSEAVHVETAQPLSAEEARALIAAEPNILVLDDISKGLYPTAEDASGEDKTLVGRIRRDDSVPDGRGLAFWVVSDNLRTGAALNAVRIAEALCADHM
jgi:hypothetical protein